MKIVDFREKTTTTTEALETIRKPPIRELSKRLRRHMDFARFASIGPVGNSVSWTPFSCAAGGALPVSHSHSLSSGDGQSTERRVLAFCAQKGKERRNLCVSQSILLVSLVLVYGAPEDCGKIPCLTLTMGQSAYYTSTNRTVAVVTVHTVSTETVYKENYMKNNINMLRL